MGIDELIAKITKEANEATHKGQQKHLLKIVEEIKGLSLEALDVLKHELFEDN